MTVNRRDDTFIGLRVREIRRRRGMSQKVLADLVGCSRGAVAKYEAGERPIDSRSLLLALAAALQVTVGDLTGRENERLGVGYLAAFHAAVPDIEAALWTAGNTTPTQDPRPLTELAAIAQRVAKLRIACDYSTLGPLLAPLLTDCYRHTRDARGADRDTAWDVLATAAHSTAAALKARGYPSLSWTAADAAEKAGRQVGGTAALAVAAFNRSQVLLSRADSLNAALDCAETTADRIEREARTLGEIETLGMLHLQASLVTAALGGDAEPHLDAAGGQAARIAAAPRGTSILRTPTFGAENVALWRMSAAMERREPDQVLTLAQTLNPESLPAAGRKAQYFVEIGRARALQRDYPASLHALLRAEHIAPQHVRNMVHVRELVGHMMRKARRDLTSGDLGRLAARIGVVPD